MHILGVITLAIILALVVLGLRRVLFKEAGYFFYFAVAFPALWEGLQLLPTLTRGFVLAAVPPFIACSATVVSLGCGTGLLLIGFPWSNDRHPPMRTIRTTQAWRMGTRALGR